MLVTLLFLFAPIISEHWNLSNSPPGWMTNLMTQILTTPLYTYRPEETQRMEDISSPAARVHYTERPHVFTLTVLDKTPERCTCPHREARGRQGPTRGRSPEPGGREEGRHLHPLRAVQKVELHYSCRPLQEDCHHLHSPEQEMTEDKVQQVVRILHPCSPGRPVSSYALRLPHISTKHQCM